MSPYFFATALLQAAVVSASRPAPAPPAPFAVGERLEYSAKLGILKMGTATLTVPRLDTVRGKETYVLEFRLTAKSPFYDVDDRLTSYATTEGFESLRFHQDFSKDADRTFDIFPDEGYYVQAGRESREVAPEHPVDDTSFFYFLRLAELEVGKTYTYRNYFKDEKNPVTVRVLKRETMELPDGTRTPVLVLHPIIDEGKGLLSKKSDTRIWITDDARRIPLQIRGKFPFGTVTLRLEEMQLPTITTAGR
jgi:hypothetical protein